MKVLIAPLLFISQFTWGQTGPLNEYFGSLISPSTASKIFNQMRTTTKSRSQCYNRAYVWSYEMSKYQQVNSKKILIYYTNKYRKILNPDWGFHIAPVVATSTDAQTHQTPFEFESSQTGIDLIGTRFGVKGQADQERRLLSQSGHELNLVMDREFTSEPMTISEWVDTFIGSGERKLESLRRELVEDITKIQNGLRAANTSQRRSSLQSDLAKKQAEMKKLNVSMNQPADIQCEMVEQINLFDDANQIGEDAQEWCYVQLVSQYYWNPVDLRELAYENKVVSQFSAAKLNTAKREAFTDWRNIGLDLKSLDDQVEKRIKAIEKMYEDIVKAEIESFEKKSKQIVKTIKSFEKERKNTTELKKQFEQLNFEHKFHLEQLESKKTSEIEIVFKEAQNLRSFHEIE